MNYRSHFRPFIRHCQHELDQAAYHGDWSTYRELRDKIICVKQHITAHEAVCGYDCDCEPDGDFLKINRRDSP